MLCDPYTPTLDPPAGPHLDTTPYTTHHPVAVPGSHTENSTSSLHQNREAIVLLPKRSHSLEADADGECTHEFLRRKDAEAMVSHPSFTSSIPSNSVIQGSSLFSGAHHFSVTNPIMIANTAPEMERKMMKLLQKKALVNATYDSAARHDSAPHCHPDTRVLLRERIVTWFLSTDQEEALFWLYGPAGAGKSAIAQSLMEYCAEHGIQGAGIFLSRANKRNDANCIIPSLAHQLALAHPTYRRAIANLLSADPTILEKRLSLQFQQLIDKPADALRPAGDSDAPSHLTLLLIDGLDECDTESAQCELIRLIASFASSCKARRLPLVCVITSRPEWQIVSAFNQLRPSLKVWREELRMDTTEALKDVEKVLRAGFERIRARHDDAFAGNTEWPAQAKFRTIRLAASGNMLFASIVVSFIDDDDPSAQLELCLKFLQGKLTSGRNPFDPLSALYQGMLRGIPADRLHNTLRILYLDILNTFDGSLSAQALANFFHIDRPTFYACLQKLRSVLNVPAHSDAGRHRLAFSHTTFADYVKVAIQRGSFGLCEAEAREDIRTRCIQWHNTLKGNGNGEDLSGIIRWPGKGITDRIASFSGSFLFKLWDDMFRQSDLVKMQEELRHFTFKDLPRGLSNEESIRSLVENLIGYQNNNKSSPEDCVVRTTPVWPTDHKLLQKYRSLIGQWGASAQPFNPTAADHDLTFVFCSADDRFDDFDAASHVLLTQWCLSMTYVLLGYGQNAVLLMVCPEEIEQGVYWHAASERIKISAAHSISNPQHAFDSFYYRLGRGMRHRTENDRQVSVITKFSLECILVSFVADTCHNPLVRLEVVTNILSATSDPLEIVNLLFQHIIRNIPNEMRLVAQRILGFLLSLDTAHIFCSKDFEHILHLDHTTISRAIQWLHPFILSWFPPSDANVVYLWMRLPYHDLRQNYIEPEAHWIWLGYHPYFRLEEQAWQEVFALWIQFGSLCLRTSRHPTLPSGINKWRFLNHASKALRSIHTNHGLTTAAIELRNFPFGHFKLEEKKTDKHEFDMDTHDYFRGLKALVHQLSQLVSVIGPIIRNQPIDDADCLLLDKWVKMGHTFEFAQFPLNEEIGWETIFSVISLHTDIILPSIQQAYRIFLIGQGHNACLIAMRPEYMYTWEDIDRRRDEGGISDENEMLDGSDNSEYPSGPWSWNMAPAKTSS